MYKLSKLCILAMAKGGLHFFVFLIACGTSLIVHGQSQNSPQRAPVYTIFTVNTSSPQGPVYQSPRASDCPTKGYTTYVSSHQADVFKSVSDPQGLSNSLQYTASGEAHSTTGSYSNRFPRDVPDSSYKPLQVQTPVVLPTYPTSTVRPATILTETQDNNNYNGTFSYSFEAENGISTKVKGYLKTISPSEQVQVMQGQYLYTAPDGTPIVTRCYADETGFHAEGAYLPVAPF